MSKERWLEAYQQVESEQPEGTNEEILCKLATEREVDIESRKIDEAMDMMKTFEINREN